MTVAELEAVVARCLRGEQAGFDALYDEFAAGVYRCVTGCSSTVRMRRM